MSSGTAITPRRRAWTDSPAACCTHEHRIRYGLPSAVRPGGAQWTSAVSAEAFARRGHRIVIVTPNYGAASREERYGAEVNGFRFPSRCVSVVESTGARSALLFGGEDEVAEFADGAEAGAGAGDVEGGLADGGNGVGDGDGEADQRHRR